MAMLMLGKDRDAQLHKSFYPYGSSGGKRHELYGEQYAKEVIEANFEKKEKKVGNEMPEELLKTDYKEKVTIFLAQGITP